jgi:hypothetical protein
MGVVAGVKGGDKHQVIYKNWRVMTVNKPSIFPVFFLMPLQRGGPQESFVLLAFVELMKMDSQRAWESRSE